MLVCPLDYRYGREEMKTVLSKENNTQKLLDVEAALARAHARVGDISKNAAEIISENANTDKIDWQEVERVEREDTKHDIMALVKVLGKHCGDAERYIHLGATSNDIIDTATALQLRGALDLISQGLQQLRTTLAKRAKEHRDTIMVGRTHAQHALPMTFGLKLAVYANEVNRHIDRLEELHKRVCVGKMSGAVGTGAALGVHAQEIQKIVMDDLGLGIDEATGQVVGRDRYAELVCLAANISASLEKFATEVRNLQRPEIMEAAESFDRKKQVGSSTMAHKKNPIMSENICGLARTLRGFLYPTLDNVILWHERDLSNSSSERITLAHTLILLDDIIHKSDKLFVNLEVFPDNMVRNLNMSGGLVMAEAIMMKLSSKGLSRQDAHELMRMASMQSEAEKRPLKEILMEIDTIKAMISEEELEEVMSPTNYLGRSKEIVDNTCERFL